jgi:hypothetical protein
MKNLTIDEMLLPLGFEHTVVKTFTAIQLSSFVFKTAKQRKAAVRQLKKLEASRQGSLDVLALRRGHMNRGKGSLSAIAARVFAVIQAGGSDLTKALNLRRHRLSDSQIECVEDQLREKEELRRVADERLLHSMRPRKLREGRMLAGIVVRRGSRQLLPKVMTAK